MNLPPNIPPAFYICYSKAIGLYGLGLCGKYESSGGLSITGGRGGQVRRKAWTGFDEGYLGVKGQVNSSGQAVKAHL